MLLLISEEGGTNSFSPPPLWSEPFDWAHHQYFWNMGHFPILKPFTPNTPYLLNEVLSFVPSFILKKW
jgi:hypothetical protein